MSAIHEPGYSQHGGKFQPLNELMPLVETLYPICRSITGDGVRDTLEMLSKYLPIEISEVPSGTPAFDWTVPDEWNIRDAYIADESGNRVVDFRANNLHVLNYSVPVDEFVDRETLEEHLFSVPENPDWIPYRTAYYSRNWGFCIPHNLRKTLCDDRYHVRIDSDLGPGHLSYGEWWLPGDTDKEILLYTHICHPSLCNDNLTGIATAAALGQKIQAMRDRRFSYRIVFAPGTIGSIVWLSRNASAVERMAHGLIVGLLGDSAPFTYKRSRQGNHDIDRAVQYILEKDYPDSRIIDFSPYGYDERQFGSPGFNLPVGRITRSVNGGYPEYHTSADNLELVNEDRLQQSLTMLVSIVDALEANRTYLNTRPNCEPQLGRRGLYRATGGTQIANRESAMLWLLNQSDGQMSLLDIAVKSGIGTESLVAVAAELLDAELLREVVDEED